MPKVSIVIPNWNGEEKLRKNLPKVLEIARLNNIEEIIIADDASADNSIKFIKSEFPEVRLIESDQIKNRGFASNVDIGVSKANGDIVFLLNSDAYPEKDFLKFALRHFDNPQVFSVGCNAGGLWAGAKFENGFFWHGHADPEKCKSDTAHQTLWASGGSSFFRKSIWNELKGLDHLYDPFYVEDLDLGYRAVKRGYINMWEPESRVNHYNEKGVIESNFSKDIVNSTAERNMLIFTWKNITSPKLIGEHKKALLKRLIHHPKYGHIFLAALKRWPEIMAKRRVEKGKSKLTDEEILSIFSVGMLYSS